jgi:hypothetical protein
MRKVNSLTAVVVVGVLWCASALTQQPPSKPKELEPLGQFVGDWTSEVTNKPAVWDAKGTKFRTVNHAQWILDGWFLEHIEVNHVVDAPEKTTKSLFLWTYDPKAEKYVAWGFQSTGKSSQATGKWEPRNKTLTLAVNDPPANATGTMTEQFLDASRIQGSLTFTGRDGKTLMDMAWTRSRAAGVVGKPTREQWSENGLPIQPVPRELKKLQPFVGEWDTEFIDGSSVVAPGGGTSKGKMTAQWILDGHFLLGTTEHGKERSLWLIGYDSEKKEYRSFRFTSGGQSEKVDGRWNGEFDTIDWVNHVQRPGITTTSSTQDYIGMERNKDGMESLHTHILIKDGKEKVVLLDLTTKATRTK